MIEITGESVPFRVKGSNPKMHADFAFVKPQIVLAQQEKQDSPPNNESTMQVIPSKTISGIGLGQLTMVEHALCAADARRSLAENYQHDVTYAFFDNGRRWRQARARVLCPAGLSPHDEFYLWGLLALTLEQPESDGALLATPHYCLRWLGVIDQHTNRGGRQYRQFAGVLERLASVTYQNDAFYDPLRGEHRRVSFGLVSYSLPLGLESIRSWRIVWDPIFWEFAKATGGHLRFDLATYRALGVVARRLFLLLSKLFYRRGESPQFELRQLAVGVLGLADSNDLRNLKERVTQAVEELAEIDVVCGDGAPFTKRRSGHYVLKLRRGSYFGHRRRTTRPGLCDSALFELLVALGFEHAGAEGLLCRYPHPLVREWTDITQAALQRFGRDFFDRSPAAYLTDNVKHAAAGSRTAPDWWLQLRKEDERRAATRHRADRLQGGEHEQSDDLVVQLTRQFIAAGQPEALARANARRCGELQKKNPL